MGLYVIRHCVITSGECPLKSQRDLHALDI